MFTAFHCGGTAVLRVGARILLTVALLSPGLAFAQSPEQLLSQTINEQSRVDASARQSQLRVAQLDEQTSEYFGEFQVAVQRLEQLRIYNSNLQTLINDQQREMASIDRQLAEFGDMEQGIIPFMYELIDALDRFIELDMPFSQNERRDRVERLRTNMERSDLTVSEKYRQIMEAYEIETQFGRNIEAYLGTLQIDGTDRKVDLLRVGRILLAYQTPDLSETGFWDKSAGTWRPLDDSYRRAITEGLRIARKQAAPSLITIPLPAAGEAR